MSGDVVAPALFLISCAVHAAQEIHRLELSSILAVISPSPTRTKYSPFQLGINSTLGKLRRLRSGGPLYFPEEILATLSL